MQKKSIGFKEQGENDRARRYPSRPALGPYLIDEAPAFLAVPLAEFPAARQQLQRIAQSLRVIRRYQNRVLSGNRDLTGTRNVRRDDEVAWPGE